MKTLLCVIPNHGDATSYWRAVGPLAHLRNAGWAFDYRTPSGSWDSLIHYDAVFIQRPSTSEAAALIDRCRLMNIPTWIDYDDNLMAVPVSNPAFNHYAKKDTKQAIAACVQMATYVSVSTQTLASVVRDDAIVIRNAWNAVNLPMPTTYKPTNTVVWRGSNTHDEDLLHYADDLLKIYHDFPQYKWIFFGSLNWQLAQHMKNKETRIKVKGVTDTMSYFHSLKDAKPLWMVVPIKNSTFNQSKSDIAWLEASWAGAAALTPAMPEWGSPAMCSYADSMYTVFKENHQRAKEFVEASRREIISSRLLDHANQQRAALLGRIK